MVLTDTKPWIHCFSHMGVHDFEWAKLFVSRELEVGTLIMDDGDIMKAIYKHLLQFGSKYGSLNKRCMRGLNQTALQPARNWNKKHPHLTTFARGNEASISIPGVLRCWLGRHHAQTGKWEIVIIHWLDSAMGSYLESSNQHRTGKSDGHILVMPNKSKIVDVKKKCDKNVFHKIWINYYYFMSILY